MSVPFVNPDVKFVGPSYLRKMNAEALRGMDGAVVIQENEEPLVVMIKYGQYLVTQKRLVTGLEVSEEVKVMVEVAAYSRGETIEQWLRGVLGAGISSTVANTSVVKKETVAQQREREKAEREERTRALDSIDDPDIDRSDEYVSS